MIKQLLAGREVREDCRAREVKGSDRRRAPRTCVTAGAELFPCPASTRTAPLAVRVRDISATGVGIVHEGPLPLGQKYVVKQDSSLSQESRLYTVVRSDRQGDGCFSIGLHASNEADGSDSADAPEAGSESNRGAYAAALAGLILLAVAAMLFF